MTLKAMVKAVNEGKTVIDKYGNKVFMDLDHEYKPYIYQYTGGGYDYPVGIWEHHDEFEILEEPKQEQITDRFELMELCRKWDKEGKRFLIRVIHKDWLPWEGFVFSKDYLENYEWTALDETGHPTGEPQKFMREVKDGNLC